MDDLGWWLAPLALVLVWWLAGLPGWPRRRHEPLAHASPSVLTEAPATPEAPEAAEAPLTSVGPDPSAPSAVPPLDGVDAEAAARAAEEAVREAQASARRALAERQAAEQRAVAERAAAEQAAREEAARQAELARLAAQAAERQRAEAERRAAEQEQARRAEAQRAEQDRIARERVERLRAEEAARRAAAEREAELEIERQAELARRPPAPAAPAAPPAPAAPAAQAPRDPEHTLVMVADDSKVVRVKTSRLLAAHRFRVVLAEDGAQAWALMAQEPPQVLITDVEMPGMDGLQLTRTLRADARTAALPVVMITSADDRLRDEAAAAGVTVLMGKPYTERDLIDHVARLAGVTLPA